MYAVDNITYVRTLRKDILMKVSELRFVLIDMCNFGCGFCHREGVVSQRSLLLRPKDYAFVFSVCRDKFGWNTATITGGEPTLHPNFCEITKELHDVASRLTLVTNASILKRYIETVGLLKRINISLHTLTQLEYQEITHTKMPVENIIDTIRLVRDAYPYLEICLNSTLINGINTRRESVISMLDFAKAINAEVKFTELLSSDKAEIFRLDRIKPYLFEMGFADITESNNGEMRRGAEKVILGRCACPPGREKCSDIVTLFLASDGKFRTCLQGGYEYDLLAFINGRDAPGVASKIETALDSLPAVCPFAEQ